MKNRKMFFIAYIVIIAVFSLLIFILADTKDAYFWISYIFTLIAISGTFFSGVFLPKMKMKNFPADFSLVPIASRYLIAEIVIVILYKVVFKDVFKLSISIKWYAAIHIIALSIAVVTAIFMVMGRNNIVSLSEKTEAYVKKFKMMAADVDLIKQEAGRLPDDIKASVIKDISDLYEKIRFSDPITPDSLRAMDTEIASGISELRSAVESQVNDKDSSIEHIKKCAEKVSLLVEERNKKVIILK